MSFSSQCRSVSINEGAFGEIWNCCMALSCTVLLLPTSFASKNLHLYSIQQGHCGVLGPPPCLCYSLGISSVRKVRTVSEFPILACIIVDIQSPLFVLLLPVYNSLWSYSSSLSSPTPPIPGDPFYLPTRLFSVTLICT